MIVTDTPEDPTTSPWYQVHTEADHADVPEAERKDGVPSRMPAELHALVGPREGDLVQRAQGGET